MHPQNAALLGRKGWCVLWADSSIWLTVRFPGRCLRFHNPRRDYIVSLISLFLPRIEHLPKKEKHPRFPGRCLRSYKPSWDCIVSLTLLFLVAFRNSPKKKNTPRFPGRRLCFHNPRWDYIVSLISLILPRFVYLRKEKNTPRFPGRCRRFHNPMRDYIVTLRVLASNETALPLRSDISASEIMVWTLVARSMLQFVITSPLRIQSSQFFS